MVVSQVRPANLSIQHRTGRSQQGNDILESLLTLCAYCHLAEHRQLFYAGPTLRICSRPKPRKK
jgi:cytochrome c553